MKRILILGLSLLGLALTPAMAQQKTAVEVGVLACSFSQ